MVEDGITHAVGLVLAPHFSALSVARYQQKVADGLELYRGRIDFAHVSSYHDAPGLVEAFAARVEEGLSRWPEDERDRVHVVFSAHSLPERVLAAGDPYDAQCRETARLVAERAGVPDDRWSWAYQSAGRTPEPWAGPDLGDHLVALAQSGVRDVVVGPGRIRLRPRRGPLRRGRQGAEGRRERRHPARASAGAERRSGVRRGAGGARPRALCRVARGGAGRVTKLVVVGGGIAGLAAARRLEALVPDARDHPRRAARSASGESCSRSRSTGSSSRARPTASCRASHAASGSARSSASGRRLDRQAPRARALVRPSRGRAASAPGGAHGHDPGRSRRARRQRAALGRGTGTAPGRARRPGCRAGRGRVDRVVRVASARARGVRAARRAAHDRHLRRRRRAALARGDVPEPARARARAREPARAGSRRRPRCRATTRRSSACAVGWRSSCGRSPARWSGRRSPSAPRPPRRSRTAATRRTRRTGEPVAPTRVVLALPAYATAELVAELDPALAERARGDPVRIPGDRDARVRRGRRRHARSTVTATSSRRSRSRTCSRARGRRTSGTGRAPEGQRADPRLPRALRRPRRHGASGRRARSLSPARSCGCSASTPSRASPASTAGRAGCRSTRSVTPIACPGSTPRSSAIPGSRSQEPPIAASASPTASTPARARPAPSRTRSRRCRGDALRRDALRGALRGGAGPAPGRRQLARCAPFAPSAGRRSSSSEARAPTSSTWTAIGTSTTSSRGGR